MAFPVLGMVPGRATIPSQPDCVDCAMCTLGHIAEEGDDTSIYNEGHGTHACEEGGDCTTPLHGTGCKIDPEPGAFVDTVERLRGAIAEGDYQAANEIVTANKGWIVFEETRNAFQVVGCSDRVVAHLPIAAPASVGLDDARQ